MPAYRVHFMTTASATVEVEAADEEAAINAAYDEVPDLCGYCSGWGQGPGVDLGEWMADQISADIVPDGGRVLE